MSWNYRGNCGSGMKNYTEIHRAPNQKKRIRKQPIPTTTEELENVTIRFNCAALGGIVYTWACLQSLPTSAKVFLSILFIFTGFSADYDN